MWRMARKLHGANPVGPNPDLDFGATEKRIRARHAGASGSEALTTAFADNVQEAADLLREALSEAEEHQPERFTKQLRMNG